MKTRTIQGVQFTEGQCVRVDGVILRLHAITKRGLLLRPLSSAVPKSPVPSEVTHGQASASAGDSFYFPLFKHMSENHGLTLLNSEMEDILRVAKTM